RAALRAAAFSCLLVPFIQYGGTHREFKLIHAESISKKKGNKPPHHKSEAPIRQWTLRNRNIIPPTCWPALLQQTAFLK
ncbi:hypothetical protein, partial [Ralstonia pseudosolanacearum]